MRPGRSPSGRDMASASTASRAAFGSRRQALIFTALPARRQVPTTSPSTRTAPGHTRDGHRSLRCDAFGTSSSRSRPHSRKNESPVGSRRVEPALGRRRAERRLVLAEDPALADRRADRGQLVDQRLERGLAAW